MFSAIRRFSCWDCHRKRSGAQKGNGVKDENCVDDE